MKYFNIFLELATCFLEWLISLLDSKKHRLSGGFMPAWKILSSKHTGFNINGKSITPKLSMQGVLVSGETGSFKTAGVIIRSILMLKNASQIIHDPSGELHEKTSGALHEQGYNILQLNFANSKESLRFNPISRAHSKSQITQLATNLVMIQSEVRQADDSFWNQKAIEVLYVLISILKTQEKQFQNLYNIAYLLDVMQSKDSRKYVDRLFASCSCDELFSKYTSICSQSDNTLSSILSTAQASVQLFSLDEHIAEITSCDTIGDFNNFRHQKTALYIHSSTSKMRYYSKIISIFLSQYFDNFFEALPSKDMLDVYHHLDETPVLSINSLDIICANIRKYRGAMMCVTQNAKSQLTAKYGKRADAIISNLRTKVYLSADLPTAQALEQTIGRYEFVDKKDHRRLKSRAVLTTDEIMALPHDKVLIMVSGMRAILTKLTPYFKVKRLNDLAQLPPEHYTPLLTKHRDIPLLPLETLFPDTDEV